MIRRRRPLEVVIASSNPGKLEEIRAILAEPWLVLRPAGPEALRGLPPEGGDYECNARAKAHAVAVATGAPALADDSGLEGDGLDGAPGPYSARVGGPGLDDAGRVRHLLAQMRGAPASRRRARFVCVASLALPSGVLASVRGHCSGVLREAPAGEGGFGYDPIFEPDGERMTLAELAPGRKHRLSHRGRALRNLRAKLAQLASSGALRS